MNISFKFIVNHLFLGKLGQLIVESSFAFGDLDDCSLCSFSRFSPCIRVHHYEVFTT